MTGLEAKNLTGHTKISNLLPFSWQILKRPCKHSKIMNYTVIIRVPGLKYFLLKSILCIVVANESYKQDNLLENKVFKYYTLK